MKRANKINLNVPEYWDKYHIGSTGYRSNTRRSGLTRYEEVVKNINNESSILEVGSNFGDFLKFLLEKNISFKDYSGLDFSPMAIEEARKEFPDYEWIVNDCQKLEVKKDKYNTIVAMQVLEHIEKPEKFLKRAFAVLKDDGKIIVTVPNDVNIIHRSHVWFINEDDLLKLLHNAGFRKIRISTINNDKNLIAVATKIKKITVVTPVLCPSENVFKTIKHCFESIRKAVDKVNGEWIIVDDNSLIGKEFFSEIADIYIRNNETKGVSTSLNRGMKIGSGSFLVKLDSDYLVPENLFEVLLKDWSDDLCFISPSFTFGRPNDSNHYKVENIPMPEGGVFNKPSGMNSKSKHQWGGGILMFDAKKLKEIDYFDEDFDVASAQDNDVIYRILMKGHNWRRSNNVLTRHFASISSNDPNAPDSRGERRKLGQEIFTAKHGFKPGGFISKVMRQFNYEETK